MTADQVQPGGFIVGNQTVGNTGIFKAEVQKNTVAAMIAAGDPMDVNLLNPFGINAPPTLLISCHTKVL